MLRSLLFTVLFFTIFSTTAQVIDIEHFRREADSTGFAGSLGINLQATKNTKSIFSLGGTAYVQYRNGKHLVFFLNNTSFKTVNQDAIINKGTSHLRYNYKLTDGITLEALLQYQYNTISKIGKRELAGGGPRFKLAEKEKYNMYLGTIFMYEYEKINNDPVVYYNDYRFSGYLAMKFFINQQFSIGSTTFYQPRLDKLSDYRIYSYNSILITLIKKLSLKLTYVLGYDTFPADGIPKFQYDLINGFVYVFD